MLVTISTTATQSVAGEKIAATDLGYVLHKHPDRIRTVSTSLGPATVFWPEATTEAATVALLVETDTIALARKSKNARAATYVNDRGYVASSFMSVALNKAFRTAMSGVCETKPALVDHLWPVTVNLSAVKVSGSEVVHRLFEPLGYEVSVEIGDIDEQFPQWGKATVGSLQLRANVKISDLLRHIYV